MFKAHRIFDLAVHVLRISTEIKSPEEIYGYKTANTNGMIAKDAKSELKKKKMRSLQRDSVIFKGRLVTEQNTNRDAI